MRADGRHWRLPERRTTVAEPQFDFDLRLTLGDSEGYYVTRWDRAQSITVRASTKQEAINKAAKALGDAPRGKYWTAVCDGIREFVPTRPEDNCG